MKSRLFLDCLTEPLATYTCIGEADLGQRVVAETKIVVEDMGPLNKGAEVYGENAIDFGGKGINANAILGQEFAHSGCMSKKSRGKFKFACIFVYKQFDCIISQ